MSQCNCFASQVWVAGLDCGQLQSNHSKLQAAQHSCIHVRAQTKQLQPILTTSHHTTAWHVCAARLQTYSQAQFIHPIHRKKIDERPNYQFRAAAVLSSGGGILARSLSASASYPSAAAGSGMCPWLPAAPAPPASSAAAASAAVPSSSSRSPRT